MAIGSLVLSVVIFYAAWQETRARNTRDTRLTAALGSVSLMGGAVAWLL